MFYVSDTMLHLTEPASSCTKSFTPNMVAVRSTKMLEHLSTLLIIIIIIIIIIITFLLHGAESFLRS